MPYVLSPVIKDGSPGMWNEGSAYERTNIYTRNGSPPVNYDAHTLRPHSLTHFETPAHTQDSGKLIDDYYHSNLNIFFGQTIVVKLPGNNYRPIGEGKFHWVISREELAGRLQNFAIIPPKILITTEYCPLNPSGFHDPEYVLTLSQEAADYLCSLKDFHLYGTTWKSSDYNPGRPERPIHNTLFGKGIVLENLVLNHVPEGNYMMVAFPLPLAGASESPVVPVLFDEQEWAFR